MEDTTQVFKEQLYSAAVGKSREGYYVPRFLAFEKSESRRSWNLSALLFGVLWFLYRRMFVSALVLGILAPVLFYWLCGIAIQLILRAPPQSWLWYVPSLAFNFVLIPVYANYLYFSSVEKRIGSLREKLPDDRAVLQTLEEARSTSIVACIAGPIIVVGVFWVANYLGEERGGNEQISAVILQLGGVQSAVVKTYMHDYVWPEHASDLKYREPFQSPYVDALTLDRGTISARLGNQASPSIAGRLISFRPSLSVTGAILWSCGYAAQKGKDSPSGPAGTNMTNVERRYLPSNCR